jgi:hypothetical protein
MAMLIDVMALGATPTRPEIYSLQIKLILTAVPHALIHWHVSSESVVPTSDGGPHA